MDFIKFFGFLQVGGRKGASGDSNNFPASIFICAESFKDIALLKLFHVPVYSFPCDAEFRRNRFLRYVRIFLYNVEDIFLIYSEFYCDVYSDIWRCAFHTYRRITFLTVLSIEMTAPPVRGGRAKVHTLAQTIVKLGYKMQQSLCPFSDDSALAVSEFSNNNFNNIDNCKDCRNERKNKRNGKHYT